MVVRGMVGASKVPPTIGGESRCASRREIPGSSSPDILGREIAVASKTPLRTEPSSRTIPPIPVMERQPKSMSLRVARSHPGNGEKADTRRRIRVEEGVVQLRDVAAVHVHDAGSDMSAETARSGGGDSSSRDSAATASMPGNDRRQGARRKRRIMSALGSGRVRRSMDPDAGQGERRGAGQDGFP